MSFAGSFGCAQCAVIGTTMHLLAAAYDASMAESPSIFARAVIEEVVDRSIGRKLNRDLDKASDALRGAVKGTRRAGRKSALKYKSGRENLSKSFERVNTAAVHLQRTENRRTIYAIGTFYYGLGA